MQDLEFCLVTPSYESSNVTEHYCCTLSLFPFYLCNRVIIITSGRIYININFRHCHCFPYHYFPGGDEIRTVCAECLMTQLSARRCHTIATSLRYNIRTVWWQMGACTVSTPCLWWATVCCDMSKALTATKPRDPVSVIRPTTRIFNINCWRLHYHITNKRRGTYDNRFKSTCYKLLKFITVISVIIYIATIFSPLLLLLLTKP